MKIAGRNCVFPPVSIIKASMINDLLMIYLPQKTINVANKMH